jgi:Ca-activated chloride channel family protein
MRLSILLLLAMIVLCAPSHAQNNEQKAKTSNKDTAGISILNILPDSFPDVSIVFKASSKKGRSVHNLTKDKINVTENAKPCEIISLQPVSKIKPVNIGIVLDHSASMAFENESVKKTAMGNKTAQPTNHTPNDDARAIVKSFERSFNPSKDKISISAFCSTVDKKLSLTGDTMHINSFLDSMYSNATSALYDGIMAGIKEVKKGNGMHVLVVITDGIDNASKANITDVILASLKENIPVYIIGLGSVNRDSMERISKYSKGELYLPKSAADFNNLYGSIVNKLDIYYALTYKSQTPLSSDSIRNFSLSFTNDSFFSEPKDSFFRVPARAIAEMRNKDKNQQNMMYEGIALLVIIAGGIVAFAIRQKKKNTASKCPVIYSIYPNPGSGVINMNYGHATGKSTLKVANQTGEIVKTLSFLQQESRFDLSDLPAGAYKVSFESEGIKSNEMPITIQK